MSKFLLSTHIENSIPQICQVAEKNGITWHLLNKTGLSVYSFEKLCHPHTNYYQDKNGDFVIIVGTWIYKKSTGLPVMEQLLKEFSPSKIGLLKKEFVGMYAAIFCKGSTCYIFNDYYGIYDVCYRIDKDQIYIGTMLHEVAQLTDNVEYDEYSFIMEAFQLGAFPNRTIYKDIHKLLGKEYCKIEFFESNGCKAEILSLQNENYKISYQYKDTQKAIDELTSLLIDYASQIDNLFGKKGLYMTGGLDSRLVFAAYNAASASMTFRFGVGGGAFSEDRHIVEQISELYEKDLEILDWSPYPNTEVDDDDVSALIGFSNWIGKGNIKTIKGFAEASRKEPFFAFSYFCEAIRLREWAEKKGKTFALEDYIDNYYINNKIQKVFTDFDGYRQFVYEGHKRQLEDIGYKGRLESIPIDLFERFRWEMSRFCDSRMEFMLNAFAYGFSLLSVPMIHELLLSLPSDVIRNAKFQLQLIANIDKKLLDIDVFSHRRPYVITKNLKKKRKLSLKTMGDALFTVLPFVKPWLTRLYRNKHYGADEERKKLLAAIESEIPSWIDVSEYSDNLIRLNSILKCQKYLQKKNLSNSQ